jgi:hypothetical protein
LTAQRFVIAAKASATFDVSQDRMRWSRELSAPIVLKDRREIVALNDARAVLRSLPARRRNSDTWLYAGGLLLEAATSDGPMGETIAYLRRALRTEGLL